MVPTAVYKCQSIHDGLPYVLRKVDVPLRANVDFAMQISEMWKQIQHSGIVTLRDVFRSGGIPRKSYTLTVVLASIFFAYDYHPASETLEAKYFNQASGYLQEDVLWSIIVQLCSAIQCVHRHRQCCRGILSPSKILVTGKNR
jgi:serine/threonine protein kinase